MHVCRVVAADLKRAPPEKTTAPVLPIKNARDPVAVRPCRARFHRDFGEVDLGDMTAVAQSRVVHLIRSSFGGRLKTGIETGAEADA